jgi:hypothetical protein
MSLQSPGELVTERIDVRRLEESLVMGVCTLLPTVS